MLHTKEERLFHESFLLAYKQFSNAILIHKTFCIFVLQIKFRRAAKKLKIPALMAHSADGSGWVRQGLAAENPIHANEPVLLLAYEDSRSVYAVIYEWVLRRGYMLLPDRVERPERADIEFDIILQLTAEEEMMKAEDVMQRVVPEDKDFTLIFQRKH